MFLKFFSRIKHDPIYFSDRILGGEKPWKMQKVIMEAVRDFPKVTVRSGHGVGKSWVAARIAIWFLYTHPYSIVLTTAPTLRQVESILWGEIKRQINKSRIPLGGKLTKKMLFLDNGWFAMGLSTDTPDRFQGFHAEHLLVIADEASGISDEIFESIESLLTSENSHLLLIGNPTNPSGYFGKSHREPTWKRFKISCFDSPNLKHGRTIYPNLVSKKWVDEKKKIWGEDSSIYLARVLGEFPKLGTNHLFILNEIEMAKSREIQPSSPCEVGVDVARFGDDRTIFCIRKGFHVEQLISYSGIDTMEVVSRLLSLSENLKLDCLKIDGVGIGAGVVDRLKQLGKVKIFTINGSEKANHPEKYLNMRAEIFFGLKEIINQIDIPDDEELEGELSQIRYGYTSAGLLKIESKDEIKRRLGRSPDKADALALAFASPKKYNFLPMMGAYI
ncbi:MAG: hypothetical protein JRI44_00170 [Deltaproteobacteria bacterium]|nr:hypothetical protein [Deltaproteobacteria bacterium]